MTRPKKYLQMKVDILTRFKIKINSLNEFINMAQEITTKIITLL